MPTPDSSIRLPLTLRKRFHVLSARHNKAVLAFLLLIVALPLLAIFFIIGGDAGFWQRLWEEVAGDFRLVMVLTIILGMAVYFWCTIRYQRLIVTPTGMEYRSLFRGPLAFLRGLNPDWRLNWQEIKSVTIKKGTRLPRRNFRQRQLVFDAHSGIPRKLRPYTWYALPDEAGMNLRDIFGLTDERFLEIVLRSPLIRILTARDLLEQSDETFGQEADNPLSSLPGGSFDLTGHAGASVLLAGLVLVGGYAVVDGIFLSPWRYLEGIPPGPFLATAVLAVALAALVTRTAPRLERWTLVGLFGLAAAGAVYPALPRINAATDPDGPVSYRYQQVETGRFTSVDHPGMPELVFTRGQEFWEDFSAGAEREFVLARGALNFWQLDLSEVRAAQRRFYREFDHSAGGG